MSAELLMFRPVFKSVRLDARSASRAFPLVQLFDPTQNIPGWTRFVKSHSRPSSSGVNAIADQRGYLHAIFVWVVESHLTWKRVLRVSNVVLSGLPGRAVADAVIRAVRDLGEEFECEAILIEPSDNRCGLGRDLLRSTGFHAINGEAFVQRLGLN